jgi:hypothetical protein
MLKFGIDPLMSYNNYLNAKINVDCGFFFPTDELCLVILLARCILTLVNVWLPCT